MLCRELRICGDGVDGYRCKDEVEEEEKKSEEEEEEEESEGGVCVCVYE